MTLPGGGAPLGVVLQLPPAPYELLQRVSGERSASLSPKRTLRLSFGRQLGLTCRAHKTADLLPLSYSVGCLEV